MGEEALPQNLSEQLENEAQLIQLAKKDDGAFEILYNHYFPRIYGYVIKRVGHREIAEDIVSTTFVKVFTSLETYEPGKYACSFAAWIFRITTNNLIDYYRKKGRNPDPVDLEDIIEPQDEKQNQEEIVNNVQDREMIQKILNELPEKDQKILNMKFFGELSNLEIAEALGVSPNNAGVLLYRALKLFKREYNKNSKFQAPNSKTQT